MLLPLCEGNPPAINGFPSQRASNVKSSMMPSCTEKVSLLALCSLMPDQVYVCNSSRISMGLCPNVVSYCCCRLFHVAACPWLHSHHGTKMWCILMSDSSGPYRIWLGIDWGPFYVPGGTTWHDSGIRVLAYQPLSCWIVFRRHNDTFAFLSSLDINVAWVFGSHGIELVDLICSNSSTSSVMPWSAGITFGIS